MQAQTHKKTSGNDLDVFRTIQDFVINLHEYFGSAKHSAVHPLNLYHRLIKTTSFNEDDIILRHIDVFTTFCIENRNAIRERNSHLIQSKILFTDRIYIDLDYVFKKADDETAVVIWEYILGISAYVDPENRTKDLLKSLKHDSGKEGNFLTDMIENIGPMMAAASGGGEGGNPMEMIGTLMNSPMFANMMGSMSSNLEKGNLDLGKLMGSMAGLVDNVKSEIEKSDDPVLKNMVNMLQLPTIPEEAKVVSIDAELD